METLYHYTVRISQNKKPNFKTEKVEVLAQNDRYIVMNDWCYTKIQTRAMYRGDNGRRLNHPDIWHSVILEEQITLEWYSEKKIRPSTIKKKMENWLSKKYGWMADADLSFID